MAASSSSTRNLTDKGLGLLFLLVRHLCLDEDLRHEAEHPEFFHSCSRQVVACRRHTVFQLGLSLCDLRGSLGSLTWLGVGYLSFTGVGSKSLRLVKVSDRIGSGQLFGEIEEELGLLDRAWVDKRGRLPAHP